MQRGEIVGVIGESGSGKSILAHALLGQVPAGYCRHGEVKATGTLALSAQSAAVFDPLKTVGQHLARWRADFAYALRGVHALREAHTNDNSDIAGCYRHQLSGGMAKQACLAQAQVQSPAFIVADEPCAGLDEAQAETMYRQLRETARTEHQGMVIISHNLRQLLRWADRIVVLRDGRLVEVTTPSAMMDGQCHAYSQALWQALPENWGHPLC